MLLETYRALTIKYQACGYRLFTPSKYYVTVITSITSIIFLNTNYVTFLSCKNYTDKNIFLRDAPLDFKEGGSRKFL